MPSPADRIFQIGFEKRAELGRDLTLVNTVRRMLGKGAALASIADATQMPIERN